MLIRKWVKPFHVCSSKRVCPTFLLARIQQKMEEEEKEKTKEEKLISSFTQTEQLLIKREEKEEEEEKDNKIIHQFPSLEIPHQIPPIKKKVLITEIEA